MLKQFKHTISLNESKHGNKMNMEDYTSSSEKRKRKKKSTIWKITITVTVDHWEIKFSNKVNYVA